MTTIQCNTNVIITKQIQRLLHTTLSLKLSRASGVFIKNLSIVYYY